MNGKPRHRWFQYSLRTFLLAQVALVVVVGVLCIWPHSHSLTLSGHYIGYYRGLDLVEGSGPFGRDYYRIVVRDVDGPCEITYKGPGYNYFRGTYPNGVLRQEGYCFVPREPDLNHFEPVPNLCNLKSARFYRPDGTLGSEVKDGTGVQTYWTPHGVKTWELELRDYKYFHARMWYRNGNPSCEESYRDDRRDGEHTGYYESGAVKQRGTYRHGQKVGLWTTYKEDGSVESEDDYR